MKQYIQRPLKFLFIVGALMSGAGQAYAYSSYANNIISYCDGSGYPLLSEYANDTCDAACHRNSEGVTAYNGGNYEYFCPSVVAVQPICTDADGDGYYAEGATCGTPADFNDNESGAYPGATEDCSDGIDNDGNGLVDAGDPNAMGCPVNCTDLDGDGYSIEGGACGAIDCNDADSAINPGAEEICSDGVDNNCNAVTDTADMNAVGCPLTCTDADGDGYSIEGGNCGAMDCDDTNPEINPAALELCDDGIDNNCDSRSDAADSVCQSSGSDDQNDRPWWRSRSWHRSDNFRGHHLPHYQREDADDDESEETSDASDREEDTATDTSTNRRRSWRGRNDD